MLAERTLICLRENGTIRSQKRLQYTACCCASYPAPSADPSAPPVHHLLVGSHAGAVMVYRDMELLWTARLTFPPLALAVGTFGGHAGMITSLSISGDLVVSYLGTDPPSNAVNSDTKVCTRGTPLITPVHVALPVHVAHPRVTPLITPRPRVAGP